MAGTGDSNLLIFCPIRETLFRGVQMQVTCLQCGSTFDRKDSEVRRSSHHFCSRSCSARYWNKQNPKRKREGLCRVCGIAIHTSERWCSEECKAKTHQKNVARNKAARGSRVVSYRQRLKQRAIEAKGGCCQICGYARATRSLHFHHLDPKQKDFGVGCGSAPSWAKVQEELKKCVLLCANCHGEVHEGLLDISKIKALGGGLEPPT